MANRSTVNRRGGAIVPELPAVRAASIVVIPRTLPGKPGRHDPRLGAVAPSIA